MSRHLEERQFYLWRKFFWASAIAQALALVFVFGLNLWLSSSTFDKYFAIIETIAGLLLLLFGAHAIFFVISQRLLAFALFGIIYGCMLMSVIIVTEVISLSKDENSASEKARHTHSWWVMYEITVVINLTYCIMLFLSCLIMNKIRLIVLALTARMHKRNRTAPSSTTSRENINSVSDGNISFEDCSIIPAQTEKFVPPFYRRIPKRSNSANGLKTPLFNTNKYPNEEESEFSSFGNSPQKMIPSPQRLSSAFPESSSPKKKPGTVTETPCFNVFNCSSGSIEVPIGSSVRQESDLNTSKGSAEFECVHREDPRVQSNKAGVGSPS